MSKVIITIAPTGSVPTTANTPHVPVVPKAIIEDICRCADAGAALAHIHARDAEQRPCHDFEFFQEVVEGVRARSNIIIQISTGGRASVNPEERIKSITLRPEMMSLNVGSVNFATAPYINAPKDVDFWVEKMKEYNVKPEIECFDFSHLWKGVDLFNEGRLEAPLNFNFVLGLKNALPYTPDNLLLMVRSIPPGSNYTVSGVGRAQLPSSLITLALGGNIRVGLEDNIYYSYRVFATNLQLVERAVRLAKEAQREVATPEEARKILGVKDS